MPLRIFQVLLVLLVSLPFAIPYKYSPNAVFPSEVAAFGLSALLVLAALALPRDGKRAPVPWMAWPWLTLAMVIGLQCVVLDTPYWSLRLIPIAYLVVGALSVLALARAKDAYGWMPLLDALAWGLLMGTLINSGMALPQVVDKLLSGSGRVYGTIGQANMYGHYLAWGLAGTAWLGARRQVPRWVFWTMTTWLVISLAWCGSRSVLLYAGAWLVLGGLAGWRVRDEETRRFGRYLLGAALAMLAGQVFTPLLNDLIALLIGQDHNVPTALERLGSNGARRLAEWHKAWLAFLAHPLLGVGWGSYPAYSVSLHDAPELARVMESKLFTHSHNSLLNLLAETGVVGALCVLSGLVAGVVGLWRRPDSPVVWLGAALLSVSLLHSLVEYPLWYFHYLGPFVLFCVVFYDAAPSWRLPDSAARAVSVVFGALGLALTFVGVQSYMLIWPLMTPSKSPTESMQQILRLEAMRRHPLTDFYADFALSNYVVANQSEIDWKLSVLDPLNRVRPYPAQLGKAALLHALRGEEAEARRLMHEAVYAYPANLDWFGQMPLPYQNVPAVAAMLQEVEQAKAFFATLKQPLR
ncbi:PglL family O-oligosaccharyltransferase [Chitiniphilus eburneus]|nr:Wzy polymerase domain-containing protein [Chitiniphilus eburneus]